MFFLLQFETISDVPDSALEFAARLYPDRYNHILLCMNHGKHACALHDVSASRHAWVEFFALLLLSVQSGFGSRGHVQYKNAKSHVHVFVVFAPITKVVENPLANQAERLSMAAFLVEHYRASSGISRLSTTNY